MSPDGLWLPLFSLLPGILWSALAILWTFFVFDFSQFFLQEAFSPAPVSPFVIPAPASLDTKAPMIPCMAILLVPLSLHFFASLSYFSASMLLFSFLAFSAFLFSSFSLCPAMSPMRLYPTWERMFTYSCFSFISFLSKISESVLSAFAVSWLISLSVFSFVVVMMLSAMAA